MKKTLEKSENLNLFVERTYNEQKIKTFLAEMEFKCFYIKTMVL